MTRTVSPSAGHRPVGVVRQALRLARTEFTLLYRYRTAAYIVAIPLIIMALLLLQSGEEIAPGVDVGVYMVAGVLVVGPMMVALMHVSNVYTARREHMILKRFRVSGVPPVALFTATTLSMLAIAGLLALVALLVLLVHLDHAPAAPVLVLLAIVLTTITMTLFGAAFTRLCRNAESAQMLVMLPFLLVVGTSGFAIPLEAMPEWAQTIARLLPAAPAFDVAVSGYLGMGLFNGLEAAESLSGADLWSAALPSLGIMVAWLAVSAYLLRYFRWDPREEK
jgi:ABC-2 type transport system permease protein